MQHSRIMRVFSTLLACVMVISSVGVQPVAVAAPVLDSGSDVAGPVSSNTIITSSTTIYVPDNYPTIQTAVNAAGSGATIIVRAGTYAENIVVSKSDLTIESESGAGVTTVQAASSSSHVFHIRSVNGVRISGFTVKGATGEKKAGISLDQASYCEVSDNVVSNNWAGIGLYMAKGNTIHRNTFSNNTYGGGTSEDPGGGGCAVEEAVYGTDIAAEPKGTLDSLRVLRDQELSTAYVDSYYEYSPDVTRILISKPALMFQSAQLISKHMPAVRYVLGQGGRDLEITEEGAREMVSFLRNLGAAVAERENSIGVARSAEIMALLDEFEDQIWASTDQMFSEAFRDSVYYAGANQATRVATASSARNVFYLNNFINNTTNARNEQSTNTWNSNHKIFYRYKGKVFEGYVGNYWSNYTGSDAYGDGIGDTAYVIDGSNRDNYPLVEPFANYATGPRRPKNMLPEPWALYVFDPVTLGSSPFEHPVSGVTHVASRWQLARGGKAVHTVTMDTGSTTEHLELFHGVEGILEPYTSYIWRVRYQDDLGLWSEWSEFTSFTTGPTGDQAFIWPKIIAHPIDLIAIPALGRFVDVPTVHVMARPNQAVNVTAYVYNIGNTVWDSGYRLVFVEGDSLGIPPEMEVDRTVAPLQWWKVEQEIEAPAEEGIYEGYWTMENPDGQHFGNPWFSNIVRVRLLVADIHPDLKAAIEELRDTTVEALDRVKDGAKQVADDADFFGRKVEEHHRRMVLGLYFAIPSALMGLFPGGDIVDKALWQLGWGIVKANITDPPYTGTQKETVYMPAFQRIFDQEDWGDDLLVETGLRFYPATQANVTIEELSDDQVVDNWELIMKGKGLLKVAYPMLATHNKELAETLQKQVDAVHLPHLDLQKQRSYSGDLQARVGAVAAMSETYLYQSGLPDPSEGDPLGLLATLRPEFDKNPNYLKQVILTVVKVGVQVVVTVVASPLASVAVGGAWALGEAYVEMQKRNAAEQIFVSGLNLMGEAVRVSAHVHGNTLGGLARLQHGHAPHPVTGELVKAEHLRKKQQPDSFTDIRTELTAVDVKNTSSDTAVFFAFSEYIGQTRVGVLKHVQTPHVALGAVIVEPGQTGTVELQYHRKTTIYALMSYYIKKQGIKPVKGTRILVTVLGINESGTFFVGQREGVWHLNRPLALEGGGSVHALDSGLISLLDHPLFEEFPLELDVYARPDDATYQGHIWLTNTLDGPLTYGIRQSLPPHITVLEVDEGGQQVDEGDGSVILMWEETLEPEEMRVLEYRFAYEGDFVGELELPAMEITFVDTDTHEVLLELLLGIPPIEVPLPVSATVSAPAVVLPGEAIESTVYLLHRLEEGEEASGSVEVSLLDREGETLHSEVQGFQVPPAGAQNLTFSLPGLPDKVRYRLATNITYEETQRSVDVRTVRVGASAPRVTLQVEPANLVFTGESLGYTVEVQNVTDHLLTEVLVSLETPSGTQVIVASISAEGKLDLEDPRLVRWELLGGLAPGEEAALSVQVQVEDDATEPDRVSLLTAQAWVESQEAVRGRSPQATTFVAKAPESLVGGVIGQVVLEGREEHGGAQVQVGNYTTSTDFDGHFALEVPAGNYTINVTRRGFLSSVTLEAAVAAGEVVDLNSIYLPAGEITGELPEGTVGQNYEATLEVTGGHEPYTWEIVAGQFPDGLTLDTETGAVSGTPTQVGTFPFTIRVTDDEGLTATGVVSITITDREQPWYYDWTKDGVIDDDAILEAVYCWLTGTPKHDHVLIDEDILWVVYCWLTGEVTPHQ